MNIKSSNGKVSVNFIVFKRAWYSNFGGNNLVIRREEYSSKAIFIKLPAYISPIAKKMTEGHQEDIKRIVKDVIWDQWTLLTYGYN